MSGPRRERAGRSAQEEVVRSDFDVAYMSIATSMNAT